MTERIALFFSLVIGLVLMVAAWGKFFYPAEFVKTLDQWVSGFEVLFLATIIIYRNRWQLWTVSSVVFASWCGYALYWYFLKLPCSCMGTMLDIPTALSISIDLLFFLSSLSIASLLGVGAKGIYCIVLLALMAGLIGYAFADAAFHSIVPP